MKKEIEIGKRIKLRREELGLTQEELGNLLWLNKSTIQRYESGKIECIKIPILHAMSKQLNVNPDWLALKTDDKDVYIEARSKQEERDSENYTELSGVYLSYAKEAEDNGIDPEDIKLAIETIKRLRGKK